MSGTHRHQVDLDAINVKVGRNIEKRRKTLRMSQSDLGRAVGVTFQQIHKYETGETRLPVDKLYLMCKQLDISIQMLFDGVQELLTRDFPRSATATSEVMCAHELESLVKFYVSINDQKTRKSIVSLIKDVSTICKKVEQ